MKNMNTTTNKPAVTIGAEVMYRNRTGSYNKATVDDIVDSEFGKMAVLSFVNKDGKTIKFNKLLRNVWVCTSKRKAEKPAAESIDMRTVTTWTVKVATLDAYSGRTVGEITVSTGVPTEDEAKKIAAKWDDCDMLHGKATIIPVTKEIPDNEPLFDVIHIIHFSYAGKEIMKNALACAEEDAAKLVSDEIAASGYIRVTNENKRVMLCGLKIYSNKLIDQKNGLTGDHADEHARITATLNNVQAIISQLSTGTM